MRHFIDDEYDSLKEYESHVGVNYNDDIEKSFDHGMMWREDYECEYDDYDRSILNHE